MSGLGKILIGLGLLLLVVGAIVLVLGRFNIPVGRLPGDIAWRSRTDNTRVYFPIVTCILLSLILSLVGWAINHFRR